MNTAELIEIESPKTQVMAPQPAAGAVVQTPMQLLTHAVQSGASVETMEKLMALHERWEANMARRAFDQAVSEAKAEIQPAIRNKKGHNDRKYADFAAIAAAVDPVICKHGLSYRFRTKQEGSISVTCILSHRDGHSEENTLSGPADQSGNKNAIQAIGSTMSYLMRYSLVQALGLSTVDDDDGKSASEPEKPFITEEQIMALRELIQAAGTTADKFCERIKVPDLASIYADKFDAACAILNQRIRGGR